MTFHTTLCLPGEVSTTKFGAGTADEFRIALSILNIVLGAGVSALLNGIHSDEHIEATNILIGEPSLKLGTRHGLGLDDSLDRVACRAIPHEDGGVVLGVAFPFPKSHPRPRYLSSTSGSTIPPRESASIHLRCIRIKSL